MKRTSVSLAAIAVTAMLTVGGATVAFAVEEDSGEPGPLQTDALQTDTLQGGPLQDEAAVIATIMRALDERSNSIREDPPTAIDGGGARGMEAQDEDAVSN